MAEDVVNSLYAFLRGILEAIFRVDPPSWDGLPIDLGYTGCFNTVGPGPVDCCLRPPCPWIIHHCNDNDWLCLTVEEEEERGASRAVSEQENGFFW